VASVQQRRPVQTDNAINRMATIFVSLAPFVAVGVA
jgi:hypothetical protein